MEVNTHYPSGGGAGESSISVGLGILLPASFWAGGMDCLSCLLGFGTLHRSLFFDKMSLSAFGSSTTLIALGVYSGFPGLDKLVNDVNSSYLFITIV